MAGRARQPATLGPASVAVHDDGDVTRDALRVEAAGDARLDGLLGGTSLDGFQQLDLRELRFLVREGGVDALDVAIRQRLQLGLGPALVVFGDLTFPAQLVQVAHLVAAYVPHRDASLLGHPAGHLDEVPPPLLGELGDREADDLAVVLRVEPDVRVPYGALDLLHGVGVEGGHGKQARLGHADVGDAPQGHPGSVDLDLDPVEQRRVRASGANGREVALHRLYGTAHPA